MGKGNKKLMGIIYPIGIFAFVLVVYYCMIVNLYYMNGEIVFGNGIVKLFSIIYLLLFHILLALCAYCYVTVMFKNPGEPPQFWGFNDRPEDRRKRFCMICNKFKPERCHHCSTCGRCVLVMDHHCPWLNNCVGFKNRKVFMLLLFYAFFLDVLGLAFSIYPLLKLAIQILQGNFNNLGIFIVGLVGLGLGITFFVIIIMFLRYHIDLLNKNKTTIEHLDEKRGNIKDYNYDMGTDWNWKTVFGKSKMCWLFPLDTGIGAPNGDGTVFMKHYNNDKRMSLVNEDDDAYFNEDNFGIDDWANEKNNYDDPLNEYNNNLNVKNNPLENNLDNGIFGN